MSETKKTSNPFKNTQLHKIETVDEKKTREAEHLELVKGVVRNHALNANKVRRKYLNGGAILFNDRG